MSAERQGTALKQVRCFLERRAALSLDDAQLLERFVSTHDETAFAALLERHGPMVLGISRRVLRHAQDAEDAFQATFLVFVRKAATLRRHGSLGGWLYGVASRVALKAREQADRRRRREGRLARPVVRDTLVEVERADLAATLAAEVNRLPEKYRLAFILCELEGRTHEEVAREVGYPVGSMSWRIGRARALLRRRLSTRGVAPAVGGVAALLAATAVPAALARSTAAVASGSVSARVRGLAAGAGSGWLLAKSKVAVVLLLVGLAVAGAVVLASAPAPEAPVTDERSQEPAAKEEASRTDADGNPLPAGAVARLGTLRLRQGGWLRGICLSPDGKTLATVGAGDHQVRLWDASDGKELRRFAIGGLRGTCQAVAFAPDGKTLAVGGESEVFLLDADSGKVLHQVESDSVRSLAFAPGGKTIAVAKLHLGAFLWEPATGNVVAPFKTDRNPDKERPFSWSLAYSPDGGRLAWGAGAQVLVGDVRDGKKIAYAVKHQGATRAVAFSSDGKLLATSGDDKVVKLSDAATGQLLRTLEGHKIIVTSLAFSPDGKLLATGSGDPLDGTGEELSALRLWDVATGKELAKLGRHAEGVMAVRFSPDGKILYAAEDMSVSRWDLATRQELTPGRGHHGWVGSLAYSPDGKTLASGSSDTTVRLWDTAPGKERRLLTDGEAVMDSVAWSPDGTKLAVGGRDGRILLWEAATGKVMARPQAGGERWEAKVAFAPDGKVLASGSRDGHLVLWDAATGKEVRRFPHSKDGIMSLAFSRDGKLLATGHINDRKETAENPVRIWDVADGREMGPLEGPKVLMVKSVAFSPDNRLLAAGDWSGAIFCWDVATGKPVRRLAGHSSSVNEVAFAPDGRSLASTSYDGTVRLWETATGTERRRLEGHRGAPHGLSFAPDGKTLASGATDTTVLIWDLLDPKPGGRPRTDLSPQELEALWGALAATEGKPAYDAILSLVAAPEPAVRLLREHLRPAAAMAGDVNRLLADLDSNEFAVREKASAKLAELGEDAESALRQVLEGKPSAEVRRRVEGLLNKLEREPLSGEPLRQARALEALEHCGTPEARRLLESLAQGAPEARLTREARTALERLKHRPRER
jgi:RNA polymerase sigma factor (sigma-70 family)